MPLLKSCLRFLQRWLSDDTFRRGIARFEGAIARVLALAMMVVLIVATIDLGRVLFQDLVVAPRFFLGNTLLELLGLVLTILIALELLQNVGAYLQNHAIQMELVLSTSLTAVARKIILLDLAKVSGVEVIGLSLAVLTLSMSYWIIRQAHQKSNH